MRRLRLNDRINKTQIKYALEAARLLGFQTESACFPIISRDGELPIPESEEELEMLWTISADPAPEGYAPAFKQGPVFDLDFRKRQGLETLFSRGAFLKDENFDLLPDRLDVKLVLPEDADRSIVIAACNVAFRLGMETTAYTGQLLAEEGYAGNAILFAYADQTDMVLEETEEGAVRVWIRGHGTELETFSALLCERFPLADGWRSWRDVLMEMVDDLAFRSADGQLAYLYAQKREDKKYTLYGAPEITEAQKAYFPEVDFQNSHSGRKIYEKVYEFPWETEVLEGLLQERIYPEISAGDQVRIEGAISEDRSVRKKLTERIERALQERGVCSEIQIICAYKQGFSWIDEVVIPALSENPPEKLEIFFKPFLPEGETQWLDENGALPSYHNWGADDPEKWYDLPIRFLQELYPIEDLLTERLGIAREKICFLAYEGEENLTYLCRAVGKETSCREFRYLAAYSERPYLDEYPQMGKVHPSTGYLKVFVNGQERLNQPIRTDLEQIWDVYQAEVLPACRNYIEEETGGALCAEAQPFFHKLLLEVIVSEPDYRVGCREDLISSLDAFHEDLYFVGNDYFRNYGLEKAGILLDAPGLLLPEIHNRPGAPVFRAVLYEQQQKKACLLCDGRQIIKEKARAQVSLRITRISMQGTQLVLEIETEGVETEVLSAYAELFSKGILDRSHGIRPYYRLLFTAENGMRQEAKAPVSDSLPKKKITDINLSEEELIGYERYREIIEELKQVEGIEVFRTAYSYMGRELYAIWLKPAYEGYLSMTKRLTRCPSEIINARHHANEVSSTNASFLLLKKLLTEECYQGLSEKLNLILVPMENVDGAAIHHALQKEHPYWKLHVARFNALGKEFYHEHFQQDTIHREAMGLTRLYEKYVPDILVDNHGVPSHEWEQPFSGYTSPSYKGFWLPRSLLYGYFWYVTDSEYAGNFAVNKKMEDVIADWLAGDEEITWWNQEWSSQFEKYAHAWMPRLFPADYYKNMINYWIPFAHDKKHRYPSIRFPWITTVCYTSEVADETAQGRYLNLCARAHVAHDEATIQMLLEAGHVYTCSFTCHKGRIFAGYSRQRPMLV